MKTTTRIIAAAAAAAGLALAGAALAHGSAGHGYGAMGMGPGTGMGPGMGMGMGMGMGPGAMGPGGQDMGAAAAGRLAALRSQLKITPAQEPAWKAYETVVTQQAAALQAARDDMHAKWQNAKPGEAAAGMAAQRQAMATLHQSGREAQAQALKDLYAVLTAEQIAGAAGGWGPGPRGQRQR